MALFQLEKLNRKAKLRNLEVRENKCTCSHSNRYVLYNIDHLDNRMPLKFDRGTLRFKEISNRNGHKEIGFS